MKCLVSPTEPVININTGEQIGWRVAEVKQEPFEVGEPMFWYDCADAVVADVFYYDTAMRMIKPTPELIPPEQPVQSGAVNL